MTLDKIDWKIITLLQSNGRKTYKELGEAIGYTSLGAKKRVDKLLKRDVIQFSALVNADALGLCLGMIQLEMESAEAMRKIIDRYSECPRIINFFTTIGGYNLIALVMAENQDILECEAMEQCSLRSGEGIRRSEFYPIRRVQLSPFLPLNFKFISNQKGDITPCGVECRKCPSYNNHNCVGCPSISYYQGSHQL